MNTLTIGKLAHQCDVGVETVRFYERKGLIKEPARSISGYRQYPEDAVRRLRFIRRSKNLGFSLAEIQTLLGLSEQATDKSEVKAMVVDKTALIQQKIDDLQRIKLALDNLAELCEGSGCIDDCPILSALNDESSL